MLAAVTLTSAAAWGLTLAQARGMAMPELCAMTVLAPGAAAASLDLALALNPPGGLAAGWALMLVAMMTPLLLSPLRHLWQRSLARKRGTIIALFTLGYGLVWMAAGTLMVALALLMRLASSSPWLAAGLVGLAAIVWHASTAHQVCLNRRHGLPTLPALGAAAERAALRYGVIHGGWCVGACWAVMLLPLLVPSGHLFAMVLAALWLFAEHLEAPRPAGWGWRWPVTFGRLLRYLARTWLGPNPSPSSRPFP